MLADPLRHYGPKEGYIYPWNVVDYLHMGDSLIAKKLARTANDSDENTKE